MQISALREIEHTFFFGVKSTLNKFGHLIVSNHEYVSHYDEKYESANQYCVD